VIGRNGQPGPRRHARPDRVQNARGGLTDFSTPFALSLALKDVRLALQAADDDRFAAMVCLG
jgi:hypothetical protein